MSRSLRKMPIVGHTTAVSEKQDKRIAAGRLRVLSRSRLAHDKSDAQLTLDYRETGHGSWDFAKDGKQWLDVQGIRAAHGVGYLRRLIGK